jgi:hypothetical protein
MRQDQRRDLEKKALDDQALENKFARYLVNKLYDNQERRKPWKKPIKCLCKGKNVSYVHGYTVPCGKYRCQEHVNKLRREIIMTSKEMTERKKNTAFWKQMRAAKRGEVYEYARKHGISHEAASIELQWWRAMDEEVSQALRIESEYYYHTEEE